MSGNPDDDNDIETWMNDRWDQIARQPEEEQQRWDALRTPDDQAYEPDTADQPDTAYGGDGDDTANVAGGGPQRGGGLKFPNYKAPNVTSLSPAMNAWNDTLASGESTGYDILYTPKGQARRRIPKLPTGQPDYSRHPNLPVEITEGPYKGKATSSAAGRYQINYPTWSDVQKAHPDIQDFQPATQDKAAWYRAADRYGQAGGRDLSTDLEDPRNYGSITRTLNGVWPSLPGGVQQQQTLEEFTRGMQANRAKYPPR